MKQKRCKGCGNLLKKRDADDYCARCQNDIDTDGVGAFADREMFGDDADYIEAAGLEFGNK